MISGSPPVDPTTPSVVAGVDITTDEDTSTDELTSTVALDEAFVGRTAGKGNPADVSKVGMGAGRGS